jgi:hypothetical protein
MVRALVIGLPFLVLPMVVGAGACSSDGGSTHGPSYGDLPPDPLVEGGAREGGHRLPDGAVVPGDDDDGGPLPPACASGTVALLAGDDGTLSAAVQKQGGPWATSSVSGGAAKSKPALVAFGDGFLAVTHGEADSLQTTRYSGGTWSGATSFGVAGVKGAPELAVLGSKAHVVYSAGPGDNRDYSHGINDGTSFDGAADPVGPPLSFGTVSAGLGAVSGALAFVENGSDHGLYGRSYDGAWSTPSAVFGAGTVGADVPATPELVAVSGGGFDAVAIFAEKDTHIVSYATRAAAAPHAWSAPLDAAHQVDPQAMTDQKLSLTLVNATTLLVAFRAQDGKGYASLGTVNGSAVTWTPSAPLGATAPAVDSTPAVAPGVCGDDAVAVYASSGSIHVVRLRGTSWGTGETVSGISGARVAIATR